MNTSNSPVTNGHSASSTIHQASAGKKTLLIGMMAAALAAAPALATAGEVEPQHHDYVPKVAQQDQNQASDKMAPKNVLVVETETFGPVSGNPTAGLGLTDQQVNKITEINDQARKEMWRLKGAEMEAQINLRDLRADDDFDAHAIMKANHTLAAVHEKMVNVRSDAQTRIYDVLTPEQRAMI